MVGSVGPNKTLIVLIGFQTANENHLKTYEVAVRETMYGKPIGTSKYECTPIMESGARVRGSESKRLQLKVAMFVYTDRNSEVRVYSLFFNKILLGDASRVARIFKGGLHQKKMEISLVSYHSKKRKSPHFIEDLVHMHAASCDPVVLV